VDFMRDISVRGNQSFPNYGRIGVLWLSESKNDDIVPSSLQYDATVQLIESLDNLYSIDYLRGCKEISGIETECIGDYALPEVEELEAIVSH
jgi:hypothetical protein